jgi:hypothetical protein
MLKFPHYNAEKIRNTKPALVFLENLAKFKYLETERRAMAKTS